MSAENEIRNIKLFEEEIRNIKQMAFDAAHPVGELFYQLPEQDDPETLYNKNGVTSIWESLGDKYGGGFFRTEGGSASTFNPDTLSIQGNQNQYHSHTINHNHSIYSQTASALCGGGSTTTATYTCFDVDSHNHTYWNSGIVSISVVLNEHRGNSGTNGSSTDTEARPDNFTIRIYKRIS